MTIQDYYINAIKSKDYHVVAAIYLDNNELPNADNIKLLKDNKEKSLFENEGLARLIRQLESGDPDPEVMKELSKTEPYQNKLSNDLVVF